MGTLMEQLDHGSTILESGHSHIDADTGIDSPNILNFFPQLFLGILTGRTVGTRGESGKQRWKMDGRGFRALESN